MIRAVATVTARLPSISALSVRVELPLEPVDVLEPDRTRYLNIYKEDLELPLENFE